jgi:biotin carboxyl carrier protein
VNVDVTIDGKPWKVALEQTDQPGRYAVVVKGRRRVIDAAWVDSETLSLVDGSSVREARIQRREGGEIDVALEGRRFHAVVATRAVEGRGRRSAAAGVRVEGVQAISAPMPGRIVRVLVTAGERIAAGQGVVVVEAMKMENELRSPKDGVVKEVRVQEGAAVESGAVLVVIE